MTALQWFLQQREPDLRVLDYLALAALEHGSSGAPELTEVDALSASLDGSVLHDLAASLAGRGHVALAARCAAAAPAGSPRRLHLLLAKALLVLQFPEKSLQALRPLPTSDDQAVQRTLGSALADLGRWEEADSLATIPQVRLLLAHRRAAALWRPVAAPTRPLHVVNLPSDTHRRRAIRRRLASLGDDFVLVRARDARSQDLQGSWHAWTDNYSELCDSVLNPDPFMDVPVDGSRGNQATAVELWQSKADTGCVVLEDDAYPYASGIAAVIDETDADLVYFNARIAGAVPPSPERFIPLAAPLAALALQDPPARSVGADGYAVSPRGARALADAFTTLGLQRPGTDLWTLAAALPDHEIAALPPSILRRQLRRRRSDLASAGWSGTLNAVATGVALTEDRDFGPARRSR